MAAVTLKGLLIVAVAAPLALADISGCACDPADSSAMEARACSLSGEAMARQNGPSIFFLKDINPSKPNRWLAIPKKVSKQVKGLADMSPPERAEIWTAAIRRAKEMWSNAWGLAYNGDLVRTQCQPHIHIGKLRSDVEADNFVVVDGPAQIPLPREGGGIWVHPQGEKLHVHFVEQIAEFVLVR